MNCKPGDLAIIVGGTYDLGSIVEVIGPPASPPLYADIAEWACKSLGQPLTATLNGLGQPYLHMTMFCDIFDHHLRPVSGLPLDETIKDAVPA